MELSGDYLIPASEDRVWAAMNDAALLHRCIAVCESFERESETLFVAKVRAKVGPFRTHFTIDVHVEDAAPPNRYRLVAEGRGGFAGWARGIADVSLAPENGGTRLSFHAVGEFKGAIARLAARVMEGAAKRYADEFFAQLAGEIAREDKDGS